MRTYKAAVVGCGARGSAHADAYRIIDHAALAACCDPSQTHRETLAETYGVTPYADLAAMLTAEKPDIVHLATPPHNRVELMTLVSEHGVPLCTVEKPIALGVADWRALQELEASSQTKFAVCHQFRWQRHLVRCRQAIAAGALGKVKFLDMSAGMTISGQGTHTLNYGRSLIGDPKVTQVFGNVSGWNTADTMHPAPETTEAFLTFDNGVRGSWTSGRVSPQCGSPDTTWQHVRIAVYADRGRTNYEEFGAWEIVSLATNESGTFGGMGAWGRNNLAAQAEFHKAMFAWSDDPTCIPGTNLRDSLHEWEVVLALYASSLERRPIDLEGFDPAEDLVRRVRDLTEGQL